MNRELAELIKQISFPAAIVDLPYGSVAVIANYYAGLFGGPISQLLKCLAAVKICAELKTNGIAAVPVCLVRQDAPPGFLPKEINFIDRHSRLHCLKSDGFGEIEKIFPDGDRETLAALKEAFVSDENLVSSCAKWLMYLLKDYNITIVEYNENMTNKSSGSCEYQSITPPVAAFVADSAEVEEYGKDPREHDGVSSPIIRACPNVTIANARSLKTLKRYGLDFERIFDGKERVVNYLREKMKSDVPVRMQKLQDEAAAVLGELEPVMFAERVERSNRIHREREAKIIYQLAKIERHSRNTLADKEKAMENRIFKACDFLAPRGLRQQDALGGAQIPLSYGMAGLRTLFERLDISTSNHQLIEMN